MKHIRPAATMFALATLAAAASATPAAAQEQPAAQPAARAPSYDWTGDRRAFVEGDLITVLIDEYALATADKTSSALQDRSRRLGLDGGYASGASGMDVGADIRTDNRGESTSRGQTRRQDRLTAEITVRVVGFEPSGMLRIEGVKKMIIDEHEQEITLRGLLRAEDVGPHNVVDSWRVADAEIAYASSGDLDRPSSGILGRIFGWIWP